MRKHKETEPLFSPESAKSFQFSLSEEESARELDSIQAGSGLPGESGKDTTTVFPNIRVGSLGRPQPKRPMSQGRWSSVATATVVVIGLGVGAYLWQPWTKYSQPSPTIEASTQVQSTYHQLLDFVPIVPEQLPQGYKLVYTQANTDISPIPTSNVKKFYVSYSNGQNYVLTLMEDKQSIPQPLNGIPASQVEMYGTTVTVGNSPLIALANFHLHDVYISALLIGKSPAAEQGTSATSTAGALNSRDVAKQRQDLLNFVKNMIRQPAQIQAQPDYAYAMFEGQYAAPKMQFRVVIPTAKSLGQYQLKGTNDPIAQITTHGNSTLSDIDYMYFSDTEQITVDERQGAYQQGDGSWKHATDLGAVRDTITIDGQKVYRRKGGLPLMWIDPKNKVLFTVDGMPNASQARLQQVMASIIKQARGN